MMVRSLGLLSVLLLASVVGCSDDDATPSEAQPTPGTPGAGAACLSEASLDFVVPLRKEGDQDFGVYQATSDGSTVFLSTLNAVYALDTGSEELKELYRDDMATVVHHYVRPNDLVVPIGTKLFSVPKTGGAATSLLPLGHVAQGSVAGDQQLGIDGDAAYYKEAPGTNAGYWKHDLASGTETKLGDVGAEDNGSIVLGPDAIYTYTGGAATATPVKVARTGGIEPLSFSGLPSASNAPLGFTNDGSLLMLGKVDSDFTGRLLRAAPAGGPATEVLSVLAPLTFKGLQQVFPAAGGTVFRFVNDLYWLPDGAPKATKVACVAEPFSLQMGAAVGKNIYVNIHKEDENGKDLGGGIARIAIP